MIQKIIIKRNNNKNNNINKCIDKINAVIRVKKLRNIKWNNEKEKKDGSMTSKNY